MKKWLGLAGWIGLCQGAGVIGSIFTIKSIENWYVYLNKPAWSPPNWLFGPVWVVLYSLMGIGVWLVGQKKSKEGRWGVRLFVVHLGFNALWSVIFFGMRNVGLALVEIGTLWLLIVWLIKAWSGMDKRAAGLLVPYLAWVSFAMGLNWAIWKLN